MGPISFEVHAGEFFSLLGPSGCGKTTTLRCIAGFETLDEGSIRLRGERLDDKPPHRRDVGLVFQNYALFPHLTVFDNIAFGLRLRRVAKAEIAERVGRILRLVDLPEMATALSGAAVGRPAAARRDRPLAGPRTAHPDVRRAALQPRLQAPHPDARRVEEPAAPARQDRDLCHPRPDRGLGAVRPHRGPVARKDRADRHPGRHLRAAGDRFRRRIHRQLQPARGAHRRARGRGRRDRRDRRGAPVSLRRRWRCRWR